MNNTDYSIDEVKLMAKVKRYKRRWKEQRNYSEYLKCKLAKKATQVRKLKAKSANWHDTAIRLSANCGTAMAEIDSLKARAENAEQMMERLIEAGGAMSNASEWRYTNLTELMAWDALVAEWKESGK